MSQTKEKEKVVNQLHPTEARWFAVYTRYKREKMVARRLTERGIRHYLPLQKLTRHYTRKIKHVELPLISCYIFVQITKPEYVPVLEDTDVVQFVRFRKNLIAIPEREIDILRRVVGEGIEVEATPIDSRADIGDEVELIGGHLTGLHGLLVEREGDRRVVIELDNMGYALRMQVPPEMINLVKKNARPSEPGASGAFEEY